MSRERTSSPAMDQDTRPDTSTPPLLSIPPDIRIIIYEMLFGGGENGDGSPAHVLRPVCHGRSPQSRPTAHALMFANMFLYAELMPLCYKSRPVRIWIPCLNSLQVYARRAAAAAAADSNLHVENTNIPLSDAHGRDEKSTASLSSALPLPPLYLVSKLTISISTPASQHDARRCIDAMRTIAEPTGAHTRQLHITFSEMVCDGRVSGSEPLLMTSNVREIDERRFVNSDWLPAGDDDDNAGHSGGETNLVVELAENKALARSVAAFRNLDVLTVVGDFQRTWPEVLDEYLNGALDPVAVSVNGPYYRWGQSMRAKFRRRGYRWTDFYKPRGGAKDVYRVYHETAFGWSAPLAAWKQ